MKNFFDRVKAFSPEQHAEMQEGYREWQRALPLAFVRESLGYTQGFVAQKLDVTQPAISRIEGRNESKMSTVWSYLHALGASVSLRIDHPDGKFVLKGTQSTEVGSEREWLFHVEPAVRLTIDDSYPAVAWSNMPLPSQLSRKNSRTPRISRWNPPIGVAR